MSHLIEEYAKSLGVKIGKPTVAQHFFPIIPEKYITISADPDHNSKKYKYYNIVLDSIRPFLGKMNIKIIQIGSSSSGPIEGVDEIIFDLGFKQNAYIIGKSSLHIGVDGLFSHYASSIGVPIVTIFGNTFAKVAEGYWSNDENKTNIEAPWRVKPTFNSNDPEDTINKIKPEIIGQAILSKLRIPAELKLKTKFIGNFYHQPIYELVPDFFSPNPEYAKKHLFLRFDYTNEDKYIQSWCSFLKSFSIFSRKILKPEFLSEIKDKLETFLLIVEKNSEIPGGYLNLVQSLGIKITLLVENPNDLPIIRNKYFDYNVQLLHSADKSLLKDIKIDFGKATFSSSKIIFSQGKKYPSTYHWKKNKNLVDKNHKFEDNQELFEELNHFYIYDTN
jgi:hypothetical protein